MPAGGRCLLRWYTRSECCCVCTYMFCGRMVTSLKVTIDAKMQRSPMVERWLAQARRRSRSCIACDASSAQGAHPDAVGSMPEEVDVVIDLRVAPVLELERAHHRDVWRRVRSRAARNARARSRAGGARREKPTNRSRRVSRMVSLREQRGHQRLIRPREPATRWQVALQALNFSGPAWAAPVERRAASRGSRGGRAPVRRRRPSRGVTRPRVRRGCSPRT